MASKIQFRAPHGKLIHPTIGEVTNENITEEIYRKLVSEAEGHRDLFEFVDIESKVSKSKPNKNDVQA